jgi:hypothetical protein
MGAGYQWGYAVKHRRETYSLSANKELRAHMRNSRQGFYQQPSVDTGRGRHPDLTESGDLKATAYLPPAERDFAEMWNDEGQRGHFFDQVTRAQMELPDYVQQQVAGETLGEGLGPFRGYAAYRERVEELQREEDRFNHGANTTVIRDFEVATMSLEDYDRHFDERGQARDGVTFIKTGRGVVLNDSMDVSSARELRSQR